MIWLTNTLFLKENMLGIPNDTFLVHVSLSPLHIRERRHNLESSFSRKDSLFHVIPYMWLGNIPLAICTPVPSHLKIGDTNISFMEFLQVIKRANNYLKPTSMTGILHIAQKNILRTLKAADLHKRSELFPMK